MEYPDKSTLHDRLTPIDRALIAQQLINQEAETEAEAQGFTEAYALGRAIAETVDLQTLDDAEVADLLLEFARLVYPRENRNGLRTFQPHHAKTGEAIGSPPGDALIEDISRWCEDFANGEVSSDELFYDIEDIHPLYDGNGRIGHIFWAMAVKREAGQWPTTLPPEFSQLHQIYQNANAHHCGRKNNGKLLIATTQQ